MRDSNLTQLVKAPDYSHSLKCAQPKGASETNVGTIGIFGYR